MISAGDPQAFLPFGRQFLLNHPGEVYLSSEVTPAAKVTSKEHVSAEVSHDFSKDLLQALQGVSLTDKSRNEGWFLKETPSSEHEFYFSEKTAVWSKCGGLAVREIYKCFTIEQPISQILWSDFNLCSPKPRRVESSIKPEDLICEENVLSGLCLVNSTSVYLFTERGDDHVISAPFKISKVWPTKYGILLERAIEKTDLKKEIDSEPVPFIFSLLHPLDDFTPVIKKTGSAILARKLSYFYTGKEKIIFSSCEPPLIVTFNHSEGVHTVWKLRITTSEEAENACSKTVIDCVSLNSTPVMPMQIPGSGSVSKFATHFHTPSNACSPFRSLVSSRIASPVAGDHSYPSSPNISALTKMAAISRSSSPGLNNSFSKSPWTASRKSSIGHPHPSSELQFMDPLSPDLCFDYEWTEPSSGLHGEPASKVFISRDISGHSYLCLHLRKHMQLKLIKFEESNQNKQWIFGTSNLVTAIDAEPIPALDLIMIIEPNFTLTLYTGLVKVSKVHIPDMIGPFGDFSLLHSSQELYLLGTPRRKSMITSTQPSSPLDDRFGDAFLSPVKSADSFTRTSITDVSFGSIGTYKSLKDPIKNKIILETSTGWYRFDLPKAAHSNVVEKCLDALKSVLPRDMFMTLFAKWYCTRNAPGPSDLSCSGELNSFLLCILSLIGYNTDTVVLGGYVHETSSSSCTEPKKQKTDDNEGTDEDWNYLLTCNFEIPAWDISYLKDNRESKKTEFESEKKLSVNSSAVLLSYAAHVFCSIHLVYEDCKLNSLHWNILPHFCSFLFELARDLRLREFKYFYWCDYPELVKSASTIELFTDEQMKRISCPIAFTFVPSIFSWIDDMLQFFDDLPSFPYIPKVTVSLRNIVLAYCALTFTDFELAKFERYLNKISVSGFKQEEDVFSMLKDYEPLEDSKKSAVLLLSELGFTTDDIDVLPIGASLGIRDAILYCRNNPSSGWTESMFNLIGREDLLLLQSTDNGKAPATATKSKSSGDSAKIVQQKDNEDGFFNLDHEVLNLRFSEDHRIHEVYQMLQSSKPVRIVVQQRPEISDYEFIEEQERHLYSICIRTMALPVGRGMFTLNTYTSVVTEALPIPKLCLTGKAPPRNATVDLAHIDVPPNMNMWPLFHNGVAAGLRISPNASQIDSTWMVYNRSRSSSNDSPTEHAGFLMALGLNGHLSNLTSISMHDYLCKGHELTSVGVLLGVSAAKHGTMDHGITKLLSIHIEALLPPTSTELDVQPVVQVASVMGIGLLYQGTGHQHMAKVMLGEIGRPPGPEMEHCIDRESYSLTAGLAFGLIMFGRGKTVSGLTDMPMADELYHYMVGGYKRPLTGVHKEKYKSPSYQIREGDYVNVDVTSPGATLALGMMFFDTGNPAIAEWMTAPDTQFLLDMVRPDFLLLRMLSKGLILWSSVLPFRDWVENNIPEIVSTYAFKRGETSDNVDYETMSQAYCNIIAGCCLCLGLRFAGSANNDAYETLMYYVNFFLTLTKKPIGDQAGKSTIETCLSVSVVALAMVMAGTGELEVLRICRHLRSRISQSANYVLYGSHIATHMALGLLFMGGGIYTLGTSPLAIGAMLCAFYPKFPTHSNDNRYHLQAFYHLYVLAVELRLVIPRQIESQKPIYTNIKIAFKDTPYYQNVEYVVKAPCILPELKLLKKVTIDDPRYWTIVFDSELNWDVLINLFKNGGNLFLKQKAGCLPYTEDPQGFHCILAQSYIVNSAHGFNLKEAPVAKFSSDPLALNFASSFLQTPAKNEREKVWQQQICGLLFECASQEKMDILPLYIMFVQIVNELKYEKETQSLWQIKMLNSYQKYFSQLFENEILFLPQFGLSLCAAVQNELCELATNSKDHLKMFLTTMDNKNIPNSIASFLRYYRIPFAKVEINEENLPLFSLFPITEHWPTITTSTVHSILNSNTCFENL